jgi:hypothetical protein
MASSLLSVAKKPGQQVTKINPEMNFMGVENTFTSAKKKSTNRKLSLTSPLKGSM